MNRLVCAFLTAVLLCASGVTACARSSEGTARTATQEASTSTTSTATGTTGTAVTSETSAARDAPESSQPGVLETTRIPRPPNAIVCVVKPLASRRAIVIPTDGAARSSVAKSSRPSLSKSAVHIATVQGMMQRLLFAAEDATPPSVDQYDCIVVDECHRGYLLDRELSETEMTFRGFDDYISKYRRVLDYFDAVKIGLTATPALHTTQIFGLPVYSYSYREAVIDGYLIDHEPPVQITTALAKAGITFQRGDQLG